MPPPHWNGLLARFLELQIVHGVDSERTDDIALHCQPGLELNFTSQGRGLLHVGGQAFPLAPGTLVLIPGIIPHGLEVHTPGHYVRSVLCVAPAARDPEPFASAIRVMTEKPAFGKPRCLHPDGDSIREIRKLISRLADEKQRQAENWREMAFSQACELLALASRLAAQPHCGRPPGNGLADRAASYVSLHLDGDLGVKTVASHFGVSREYFSRLFHQRFGVTYKQHVVTQRLAAARRLLADTDTASSLLDIAQAVGFQSHSHFATVFRRHEGVTPSQFRELRRIGA